MSLPRPRSTDRPFKTAVFNVVVNPLSPYRQWVDLVMVAVVVASVIALFVETSLRSTAPLTIWARRIEDVVVPLFIIEYLLRLWVASDFVDDYRALRRLPYRLPAYTALWRATRPKLTFMAHPLSVIDLLAILPFFRPFRLMRVFLLFRFLKLLRYSTHIGELLVAFRERSWELGMVALLFFGVLTVSSFSIFILEADVNPNIATLRDAFWWAIVTITTVGYGDVVAVTGVGKLLSGGVMLSGFAFLAFLTSIIASALTEKLLTLKGKKIMQDAINKLRQHYVVCGYGQVGETVADELASSRVPFVVLERDPERAEVAAKKGYAVHVGSAVDEGDLTAVRLGDAAGLVSTMSSEVENVYTVLTARETNPGIHIVARSSGPVADNKLRRVGANRVISPTSTGSRHMAHVLLRPTASDFVEIAMSSTGAELQMEEIPIPAESKIIGQTLQASGLGRDYRVLVVAVKRADGSLKTVPPGSTEVQEHDVLLCIGSLDDLERLRHDWQRGR
jgi:voltage-gated potassium channel